MGPQQSRVGRIEALRGVVNAVQLATGSIEVPLVGERRAHFNVLHLAENAKKKEFKVALWPSERHQKALCFSWRRLYLVLQLRINLQNCLPHLAAWSWKKKEKRKMQGGLQPMLEKVSLTPMIAYLALP